MFPENVTEMLKQLLLLPLNARKKASIMYTESLAMEVITSSGLCLSRVLITSCFIAKTIFPLLELTHP